jgi:hypothetical protein
MSVPLRLLLALLPTVAAAGACATPPDPQRYRLAHSGEHWDRVGDDRVFEDLRPRYPEFFAAILDPDRQDEPNVQELRGDLERQPTDRRSYDALNALAIAYFEINYRAESGRGEGFGYLARSFQSAKLLAVPWRAYSITVDPRLRDAILDFFEDAGSGEKLGSSSTAPRVVEIVSSLARKEDDAERRARIRAIAEAIRTRSGSDREDPEAPSTP